MNKVDNFTSCKILKINSPNSSKGGNSKLITFGNYLSSSSSNFILNIFYKMEEFFSTNSFVF